jgi:hypothetical protein
VFESRLASVDMDLRRCAWGLMHLNRLAWVIVVLGGLTAVSSILASVFGAPMVLLAVGSTIFTIAAAAGTFALQERQHRKQIDEEDQRRKKVQLERQEREHLERQKESTLAPDCAYLLRKAKTAVEAILASDACTDDWIRPPIDEELLRDNVQDILATGRKITDLRAWLKSTIERSAPESEMPTVTCPTCNGTGRRPAPVVHPVPERYRPGTSEPWRAGNPRARQGMQRPGPLRRPTAVPSPLVNDPCPDCSGSGRVRNVQPGPMTADGSKQYEQVLAMALEWVTSRVENLEHYASTVKKAEATYRDWAGAQELERRKEELLDLLANTARDERAVEELKRLTERTIAAEQAFRQSVREANLVAETLALPDEEGP